MAIRWDPLLASALALELDRRLRGARSRALLFDADSRTVLLHLRDTTLAIDLHPERGWISLLPPAEPSAAAMRLAARVRVIASLPDESAIVVGLQRVRGREESVELVLEWVGNRWNALLVGRKTRQIRLALFPREERTRVLRAGVPYLPPPATARRGLDGHLSDEEWRDLLGGEGSDAPTRRRALLSGVAWSSALNAPLLLGDRGRERWSSLLDPERWGALLLDTPHGLQPYPVDPGWGAPRPIGTLLEGFAAAREVALSGGGTGGGDPLLSRPDLERRTHARLRKLSARVAALRRELDGGRDPLLVRGEGDLLLAHFHRLRRGDSSLEVEGFDGVPVRIELDPTLPPQENVQRLYREAARLERRMESLPPEITRIEGELARWEELLAGVREGRIELGELERALGSLPELIQGQKGRTRPSVTLPYRRFRSSGGLEIRVGRGARENDALTQHFARPRDIWLHAQQCPGAHVILCWGREEAPPTRDLEEAAVLAALHSEARHSSMVPVDWTPRRHVRKPRGAAPGAVVPSRTRTLFVAPDAAVAERLRAHDGELTPSPGGER